MKTAVKDLSDVLQAVMWVQTLTAHCAWVNWGSGRGLIQGAMQTFACRNWRKLRKVFSHSFRCLAWDSNWKPAECEWETIQLETRCSDMRWRVRRYWKATFIPLVDPKFPLYLWREQEMSCVRLRGAVCRVSLVELIRLAWVSVYQG